MMNIDKLFAVAKEKGISDVQVFLNQSNELSITVFNSEIDKYEISDSSSLVVRGIYNGKMGSYVTEILNDSLIDEIVDHLVASAKMIDSEDEAIIYEGDKEYTKVEGLFNEDLVNVSAGDKIEFTKKLDALIHKESELVTVAETQYSEVTKSVMIQNTKGLNLYNKVNSAYVYGEVIAKNETDQRTGFDIIISNEYSDFNAEQIAKDVVQKTVAQLGAAPVPSKNYEIIFEPHAFATLFSAFQGIFSGLNVQKGFSLLKGKLGEVIGSELVTIVDDPFLKKSRLSRSFDDEGVATKYKELVSKGKLNTFLHNLVTAKKDGVSSTGNGFGTVVSPTNIVFLPGESTNEEIISSVKDGILITDVQGAHAGANPVSGDFSLQATGFVVENGKVGAPVALITVAGNFVSMLKDIVMVGNETKMTYYGITCPNIKVKSMPVSGK